MLRSSPLALLYHFPHSISSLCHSYSVMQAEIFPVRFDVFFFVLFFSASQTSLSGPQPNTVFLVLKDTQLLDSESIYFY